jgi:hypothetical protein
MDNSGCNPETARHVNWDREAVESHSVQPLCGWIA